MTAIKSNTVKTTKVRPASTEKRKGRILGSLGRIGKALMYPTAVLPLAAILMRIGAAIPDTTAFSHFVGSVLSAASGAVFDYLYVVFGVGVAFGLTKDNRGEAALCGFVGLMVLTGLMRTSGADLTNQIYGKTGAMDFHDLFSNGGKKDKYDPILAENVLNGIIVGMVIAWVYNKFNGVALPPVLGFFSGRRLIPVLSILSITIFGILWAIIFPWFGYVLAKFSEALADGARHGRYASAGIMGAYGIINRLLLPFGLHHIPNTYFWFSLDWGVSSIKDGTPVFGDITTFLNGVSENNPAGLFQSGFFPIMMFGLPALVGVFYVMADDKEQKRRVIALFGSAAIVSFLTGITEPIEFAFLFTSPVLFGFHAIMTGVFGFVTGLFGIQLGFGFSAGFLDYVLSIPKSTSIIAANKSGIDAVMANPGWIFAIGAATAATYFFGGKFIVKTWNVATPGRGENIIMGETPTVQVSADSTKLSPKATAIVKAFGGYENITNFQNCMTRLRYDVKDASKVNKDGFKAAGAMGTIVVSPTHVQVIVGTTAELLNNEIAAHAPAKEATAKTVAAK